MVLPHLKLYRIHSYHFLLLAEFKLREITDEPFSIILTKSSFFQWFPSVNYFSMRLNKIKTNLLIRALEEAF